MKDIVQAGYDKVADRYEDWSSRIFSPERDRVTSWVLDSVPQGGSVLELGCGNGAPVTRDLSSRFQVTAVDISSEQIRRAKQNAPRARFIQHDMAGLQFDPATFDAVVALFSIIHLPCEEHGSMFNQIHRWLKPGGLFVVNSAASAAYRGYDANWLGAPMFWSHHGPETTHSLIRSAGFEIVSERIETINEDPGIASFVWWTARKPIS